MSKPIFTLYGRTYCHLCDDMLAALETLLRRGEFDFAIEVKDVDANPEWVALYDQRVPVLTLADVEVCHYFLDVERVRQALQQWPIAFE